MLHVFSALLTLMISSSPRFNTLFIESFKKPTGLSIPRVNKKSNNVHNNYP